MELDLDAVAWTIREHLFWLNTDVDIVTDRAVRRRFVRDDDWGEALRVVSWSDTLGSHDPDGRRHVELLVAAERRIAETRSLGAVCDPCGTGPESRPDVAPFTIGQRWP